MNIRRRVMGGEEDYSQEYLTIDVKSGDPYISYMGSGSLYYSTDDGNSWYQMEYKTSVNEGLKFYAGNKILLKGTYTSTYDRITGIAIRGTSSVELYGNPLSVVYGDDFISHIESTLPDYAFSDLFHNSNCTISASKLYIPKSLGFACCRNMFGYCVGLTTAPELPATTLKPICYENMFSGCTSLTTAPVLPATTLANGCYRNMFSGCTSLTTAPVLPATTLVGNCYNYMFNGCTSLKYIKCMILTAPSTSYCQDWVKNVNGYGTFVKNSAATWTNSFGTSAIPSNWTVTTASS